MKDLALGEGGGVTNIWRNEIAHKGGRRGRLSEKVDGDGLSV